MTARRRVRWLRPCALSRSRAGLMCRSCPRSRQLVGHYAPWHQFLRPRRSPLRTQSRGVVPPRGQCLPSRTAVRRAATSRRRSTANGCACTAARDKAGATRLTHSTLERLLKWQRKVGRTRNASLPLPPPVVRPPPRRSGLRRRVACFAGRPEGSSLPATAHRAILGLLVPRIRPRHSSVCRQRAQSRTRCRGE